MTVTKTETLSAIAVAAGYNPSAVATVSYTINLPQAATPRFSLDPTQAYISVQPVTLTDATAGATIYYTTNGTTPTVNSTPYTGQILVGSTETIEAIAVAPGNSNSAVATATYTITPPAPTPSIVSAGGQAATYPSTLTVTLADADNSAAIFYTTDGTAPSSATSMKYSSPLTVSKSETISAVFYRQRGCSDVHAIVFGGPAYLGHEGDVQ
jgi:hypothetical protein